MATPIELSELPETTGRRSSFAEALEAQAETDLRAKSESKSPDPPPPPYVRPSGSAPAGTDYTDQGKDRDWSSGTMGDIVDFFKNPIIYIVILVVVGLGALLVVILVPLHFADLDYWQIGFRMQQSTGEVFTDRVYGPGGRYGLGVDYTFRTFNADAHHAVLSDLAVNSNNSLEIFMDVEFQYFIRPMELQMLHNSYDQQYNEVIVSTAESIIKGVSREFSTNDFFLRREEVQSVLANRLFVGLAGNFCCDSYCTGELYARGYLIPGLECTGCNFICENPFFNIDVRYFQLLEVRIPNDVAQQFLNAIIQLENADEEQFKQERVVVSLGIERDVQQIMNEAVEVEQEASANATLIRAIATSNATALVEEARTRGLSLIFDKLNVTDPEHKASLDYLRTLRRSSTNARLHVGFQNTISGPYNN